MSSNYEEICKKNIKEYGEGSRHLSYFADIYSTRTHFIFEVLQNAEDALSRRPAGSAAGYVHFHLHSDRLEIRHNGAPFNELDVTGICGIGEGTKAGDYTQIGKFGIGFKSVYAYTFFPKIHSGGEHFEIRRFVEPHAITRVDDKDTLIVLPFDQPDKRPAWAFREGVSAADAVREIGNAIRTLGIRTLLFLRHIEEIKWTLPDDTAGQFVRNSEQIANREWLRKVEVLDQDDLFEEWRIFERRDVVVQDAGQSHQVMVEIAFLLKDGTITRADNTELVVFFPTEKKTELGFLIQAPFKATKARDNIKSDDSANRQLIEAAAQLAADILLALRDLGLLSVASYAALPLRAQDFPENSLFRPVYDRVREALNTQPLLPAHGGGFVCVSKAKLARGEKLVRLFSFVQLGALFGKEELEWLDESITESSGTADLHTYLLGRKKSGTKEWELDPLIEGIQVDADILAPRLTTAFLSNQPIDWLIRFILYAIDGAQSLKRVPFIRLSSGRHVCLTNFTEKPLAWFAPKDTDKLDLSTFPLVHNELAANKQIMEFLNKENISEINSAAIVFECILPKYKGIATPLVESKYRADLQQIRKAFSEITVSKTRMQFPMQLRNFAWIACIHASGKYPGKVQWKKQDINSAETNIFTRTDENEAWFKGLDNIEAYFLHPSVNEEFNGDVGKLVRTASNLTQNLALDERPVTLKDSWGNNKKGLNGFKPDATVIGLQAALDSWNTERASILWNIMLSAPRIVSGETQSSSNAQKLDAAQKKLEYTEVGKLCRDWAWLPDRSGEWRKPSELFLSDLPDGFDTTSIRAKEVEDKLGMKRFVSSETIEALGFSSEDELRRAQAIVQSPDEFREFEEFKRRRQEEVNSKPALPNKTSPPKRREEKIAEEARNTPEKTQETRERTVDPEYSGAQGDARIYLAHQYTDDDGVMFCQLCQAPQPVMLNGAPHFEAVDCVSGISFHYKQNNLALCPNHAAMYKNGSLTPDVVQRAILESEYQEIPLNLAGNEVMLYFTQQHLGDLRAALSALDSEEK